MMGDTIKLEFLEGYRPAKGDEAMVVPIGHIRYSVSLPAVTDDSMTRQVVESRIKAKVKELNRGVILDLQNDLIAACGGPKVNTVTAEVRSQQLQGEPVRRRVCSDFSV